jgi:hypothetical protein
MDSEGVDGEDAGSGDDIEEDRSKNEAGSAPVTSIDSEQ